MSTEKRLYFHVGTVKTGSTYIQKVMWENLEAMCERDLDYIQITPPRLDLPRYANADFLFDGEIDEAVIGQAIDDSPCSKILVSDEALWGQVEKLRHRAIRGYRRKAIVYVRPPADLIAAWASENAQPHNFRQQEHSSGVGVVPIEEGVRLFANRYEAITRSFIRFINAFGAENVIVRRFDRHAFEGGSLIEDFLSQLEIDIAGLEGVFDAVSSQAVNVSSNRKYCDVSSGVVKILRKLDAVERYSKELVDAVCESCQSGDTRPVIETLTDDAIHAICSRMRFFVDYLIETYGDHVGYERTYLPEIYGVQRPGYQPLSEVELEEQVVRMLNG